MLCGYILKCRGRVPFPPKKKKEAYMIKIENVYFKYKDSEYIFNDVNFQINKGECIAIVGKNGAGKSTLAKLIAGIIKPTKGNIFIDEINTKDKKQYINLRKKVGIVFQNPENQIIFNDLEDEMSFALKNLKLNDIDLRIENALNKVKLDKNYINQLDELSLGQKQKITIAGVLAVNPDYIVFDEPTTMIDSEGKEAVYNVINSLKQSGYTIIYITNNTEEILMADKTIILNDKNIAEQISKNELAEKTEVLKKYNLKVPVAISILNKLKENGININPSELTVESVMNEMIEVMKK